VGLVYVDVYDPFFILLLPIISLVIIYSVFKKTMLFIKRALLFLQFIYTLTLLPKYIPKFVKEQ